MVLIEFLRQFRFGEYAIFDFVVSFVVIFLISPLLSKLFLKLKLDVPKQNWLLLALPISIVSHMLVGNITPMTRNFLNLQSHYMLKAIILISLIYGLKGIKMVKTKK